MSGAVKSGLIFGLAGLVLVAVLNFVTGLCSPFVAALVGGAAGYLGVRWSSATAGVGQGVLAGTIAGAFMLVSSIVFFVVAFGVLRNDPQFAQMLQQMLQQQGTESLSPDQTAAVLNIAAPVAGFCLGLINLFASLACSAIGGVIATGQRNRPPAAPRTPMGPPPMSPMG